MTPRLSVAPRRLYLGLILVLSAALLVLLAAYARVGSPESADITTTTRPADGTVGEAVFSYAVPVPADRPFRPRNMVAVGTRVYVADSEGQRVAVLDLADGQDGEIQFIPITRDSLEQELERDPQPTAVGALPDGTLLVADAANGRVWRLTQDGSFLGEFVPEAEKAEAGLTSPVGLTVSAGEVLVTDVGDHVVKVFTHSGVFLRSFGEEGFHPGEFSFPNAVAVGRDGFVYVADSNNRRVQVLGASEELVTVIDRSDTEEGLVLPRALGFDRFSRLHVVDTFGQAVHVYDADGVLLYTYGRGPGDTRRLTLPEGIAITADHIVISDGGARRLVVYSY